MLLSANIVTAQFSPGELSLVHRSLEGSTNCTKCHEVGREISGAKCLGCHEEIKQQFDLKRGYHFTASPNKCVSCHKEHLGLGARTILFDEKKFDHSLTGSVLTGKHLMIACEQCHSSKKIRDRVVQNNITAYPHQTYLGLTTECMTCHEDPHRKQFSQDCATCHSTVAWSPVQSFDHSKTTYPLVGKHLQVSCSKCHSSMEKKSQSDHIDFKTANFSDCTPCHVTPHKSKFGGRECISCHTPQGWIGAMGKPFDHQSTAYPLVGKHSSLRCEQCHHANERETFTKTFFLPFKNCTDCHADKHNGDFLKKYNNNCAKCHTEQGYKPSTFTLARHQETRFILTGAHIATVCSACHSSAETKTIVFHFSSIKCESCHKDVHKGQFASQMKGSSCNKCHSTEQWKTSTFDHSQTSFPLAGKHAEAGCADCHHQNEVTSIGTVRFKKVATECQSCHKDVHRDQFRENTKTNCARCHSSSSWASLGFDHETQSTFSLKGAHKKVPCNACHKAEKIGQISFVLFKPLSAECESCHHQRKGR